MSIITKTSAKAYFETGDFPTQAQFADMIDSYVGLGETSAQALPTLNITTMLSAVAANVASLTVTNATINNTATIIGLLSASGGINSTTVSAASVYGTTIIPTNITGTTTNNNASSGSVGEISTNSATTVSLTNNAANNITSLALSSGDWDVSGTVAFKPAGTTVVTGIICWISTNSSALPSPPNNGAYHSQNLSYTVGANPCAVMPTGVTRISIATSTNVYLEAQSTFSTSTMTADGFVRARRVR